MNTIFIQELLLRVQQLPGEAATLQERGLKNEVISFDFEQVFVKCPSLPQMRHFRTPVRRPVAFWLPSGAPPAPDFVPPLLPPLLRIASAADFANPSTLLFICLYIVW